MRNVQDADKRSGDGRAIVACALATMLFVAPSLLLSARASTIRPQTYPLPTSANPPGAQSPVQKNATFGIQPAGATKPDERTYFDIGATPGASLTEHFAIINYSLRPLTLSVRTADAVNTAEGAFALLPQTQRNRQVGTWMRLLVPRTTMVVPKRSYTIVPFKIAIPRNAQPGDHAGGVTVTLTSAARSPTGQTYKLLQTVGSRVFIRISGVLRPRLSIEDLSVHYSSILWPFSRKKAVVTYTVHNTGNVALGARQTVSVSGLLHLSASAENLPPVDLLLPGFSVRKSVVIGGVVPQIWMSGSVSLLPLSLPGAVNPPQDPYTGGTHFWSIPWLLLAIIIFLILAGRWIRRRRRRTPPRDAGVEPQTKKVPERVEEPVNRSEPNIEHARQIVGESQEETTFTTPTRRRFT